MDSLYSLAVKMSLSMGSLPSQVATGVRLFSGLESQMLKTAAASEKLNLAVRSMAMIGAGVFVASAGFGLLGFLDKAAQKAMALQQIMVDIQQTTGATPAQIAQLQATSTTVGMRTALSQIQVAQVQQASVHAGLSASQANTLTGPLAQFAMIQMLSRGVGPAESGRTATEFAHIFRAYDPKNVGVMTSYLTRALSIVPQTPKQFETLVSQYAGSTRTPYGSNTQGWIRDSLTMATLFSQMGQGSRGGTQYARLIQQLFGSGHGKSPTAIRHLESLTHTQFADTGGQFIGADRLVEALSSPALQKLNPVARQQLFQTAFGSVGLRIGSALSDPAIGGRLRALHNAFNTSIDAGAYRNSPHGKITQLQADMDTIQTKLGPALVDLLAKLTPHLIQFAESIIKFDQAHPEALRNLGKGLIALAGLFIAGGAGMILVNGIKLITTVFGGLRLIGPVLGFVADIVGTIAVIAGAPVEGVVLAIAGIAIAIGGLIYVATHFHQVLGWLGDAFGFVFNKVHDFLSGLGLWHDAPHTAASPALTAQGGRSLRGGWGGTGPWGGAGGGGVAVHINGPLHVHGTDQHAARAVVDMIGQHLHDSLHHDSAAPHGLQPGLAGH